MIILPAGTYYIGDPCYAIRDDNRWEKFCGLIGSDPFIGEFEGTPIFVHGTAYGDGCYPGSDDFEYGVDAGLIGAIPTSILSDDEMEYCKALGTFVTFPTNFTCDWMDGVFYIGHITIDTN